jgi:hypothetical protein
MQSRKVRLLRRLLFVTGLCAAVTKEEGHGVPNKCSQHAHEQKLEKAIVSNIEQEIAGRAKAQDQNLKVVNIQLPDKDAGAKRKTTGQILKGKAKS